VPADGKSLNGAEPAEAYCCDIASDDANCDGSKLTCTGSNAAGGMPLPLWSTYWPGAEDIKSCGGALSATDDLQTMKSATPVITERSPDNKSGVYYTEACIWTIDANTDDYFDDAFIFIYVDEITDVNLYLFSGTGRTNATRVIEDSTTTMINSNMK